MQKPCRIHLNCSHETWLTPHKFPRQTKPKLFLLHHNQQHQNALISSRKETFLLFRLYGNFCWHFKVLPLVEICFESFSGEITTNWINITWEEYSQSSAFVCSSSISKNLRHPGNRVFVFIFISNWWCCRGWIFLFHLSAYRLLLGYKSYCHSVLLSI